MHKSYFNAWNDVSHFLLQQKDTPFCVEVVKGLVILEEFSKWFCDNSRRNPRIDRFSMGVFGADQFSIASILEGSTCTSSSLTT